MENSTEINKHPEYVQEIQEALTWYAKNEGKRFPLSRLGDWIFEDFNHYFFVLQYIKENYEVLEDTLIGYYIIL